MRREGYEHLGDLKYGHASIVDDSGNVWSGGL